MYSDAWNALISSADAQCGSCPIHSVHIQELRQVDRHSQNGPTLPQSVLKARTKTSILR